MSNRHESNARTIHPDAISRLGGEEVCIVALGVARDLRSGVIPPEQYNQANLYDDHSRCIAGHIAYRMGINPGHIYDKSRHCLFSAAYPSNPMIAADAIERFVYDGSQNPFSEAR